VPSLRKRLAWQDGAFSSVVLEKRAQVIASSGNLKVKDLRTSKSKAAPTKKRDRDGATAKRVHVTGSGPGLRLMFWELPNGEVEFSTLRNKFDVEIDDGCPV
jgi:hypothetical protein